MNFHKSLIQDCISDIFLLEKMNGGEINELLGMDKILAWIERELS
jgi:hypothetical protein